MPTARFCAPLSRLPPPLRRLSLHPLQSILRGRPGGTPRTDPALPPAQGLLTCFSLTSPRLPGRPTRRAVHGPSPLLLLQSGVPGRRAASFAHRLSLRIAALTARRRAQLPVEWLRDQVAPRQARVSPPPGQVRIRFPGGGGGGRRRRRRAQRGGAGAPSGAIGPARRAGLAPGGTRSAESTGDLPGGTRSGDPAETRAPGTARETDGAWSGSQPAVGCGACGAGRVAGRPGWGPKGSVTAHVSDRIPDCRDPRQEGSFTFYF